MALYHRHGGEITAIKAVGHETYDGVASWHFIGDVKWSDGSESKDAHIAPNDLCFDNGDVEGNRLHARLSAYLGDAGEWHKPKRSKGRVYHWTPHTPNGSEAIR